MTAPQDNSSEGVDLSQYMKQRADRVQASPGQIQKPMSPAQGLLKNRFRNKRIVIMLAVLIVLILIQIIIFFLSRPPASGPNAPKEPVIL